MKVKHSFIALFLVSILCFSQKPKVYYVADPMCSWCYGFTPQFEKIYEKYSKLVDFEIIVGGLNTETNKKLDLEMRDSFKDHWQHIHKETGMPFDYAILNEKDLVYNTELPCRAVVAVKNLDYSLHIRYFKLLQKSFYTQNKNITKKEVVAQIASELGIDKETFLKKLDDPQIKVETKENFERVEKNGIEGFPTLIFVSDKETKLLNTGYTKHHKIEKMLDKLLCLH